MTAVIPDPDDPTQYIIGDSTDGLLGVHQGASVLHNVHPASKCLAFAHCVIHNPSEHHMRTWPLTWRDDKGVMERQCPHGVGHPDPDDAHYLVAVGREAWTRHGCDGCCADGS